MSNKKEEEHGIDIRCQFCKVSGHLNFKKWKIRFTGALEIACPRCGKVSVYIGKFGQKLELTKLVEDIEEHGTDEQKRSSLGSQVEPRRETNHDFPDGREDG